MNTEYVTHLTSASGVLREFYDVVVYVTTNSVNTARFKGQWKSKARTCETNKTNEKHSLREAQCDAYKQACVARYNETFRDACANLAFDTAGSATLARLQEAIRPCAAVNSLGCKRCTYRHVVPLATVGSPQLLSVACTAGSTVDVFVDRYLLGKAHPECTPDGRHYFGLELVTARVIADTMLHGLHILEHDA